MQLEAKTFLRLVESAGTIGFFDLEATGLKGDYNSVLCISIRPLGKRVQTYAISRPGHDKEVVKDAAEMLRGLDCWVSYYGKGFDFAMINTRLLKWGLPPLERKPHIDMYYTLKSNLNTSRRSQAHLLEWLRIKKTGESTNHEGGENVHKMTVSADEWNEVLANPRKAMPTMIRRCESDTLGLQALYLRTRHLVKDIR